MLDLQKRAIIINNELKVNEMTKSLLSAVSTKSFLIIKKYIIKKKGM